MRGVWGTVKGAGIILFEQLLYRDLQVRGWPGAEAHDAGQFPKTDKV